MPDGRHVGQYWKYHYSPINGPIRTKVGWSHPITSPTCPPWCGCHGNSRCLATVHWTFSSYGRLQAEHVNQFWWNLVHSSRLGPQWPNMKMFKMQDGGRPPCWKIWKCHNSPTNWPIWTKLGSSHSTMSPTCPPWCGYHSNGRCLATVHWTLSSYGRLEAESVNQFWWNLVHNSKLRPQWESGDEILKFLKFKMADGRHVGKYWKCRELPSNWPIWTKLGLPHHIMSQTCRPWCGSMATVVA